ncbi:hypothetical protein TNCV_629021 [Trichonephila clavipes]|nr:hypothetical protein TNCV_629021 [Trichonephila clavipes]
MWTYAMSSRMVILRSSASMVESQPKCCDLDFFPGKSSELIAISGTLDSTLSSYKDSTWILTDSRSSIEYLKNWPKLWTVLV